MQRLYGATTATEHDRMAQISPKPGSLGAIIRSYKAAVTRWCRNGGDHDFAWQPRFYDHIIRDERALLAIRKYIAANPRRWSLDRDKPDDLWR